MMIIRGPYFSNEEYCKRKKKEILGDMSSFPNLPTEEGFCEEVYQWSDKHTPQIDNPKFRVKIIPK